MPKVLKREQSEKLFQKAKSYFPGGVNSPVRAFKSVGGTPLFIDQGKGSILTIAAHGDHLYSGIAIFRL